MFVIFKECTSNELWTSFRQCVFNNFAVFFFFCLRSLFLSHTLLRTRSAKSCRFSQVFFSFSLLCFSLVTLIQFDSIRCKRKKKKQFLTTAKSHTLRVVVSFSFSGIDFVKCIAICSIWRENNWKKKYQRIDQSLLSILVFNKLTERRNGKIKL